MNLVAFPGWASPSNYFDFLGLNISTYDWGFYSQSSDDYTNFVAENCLDNFIIIAYSMGGLKALELAQKNPFCKGIILMSSFLNFCGEGKSALLIKQKIRSMKLQARKDPLSLLQGFHLQADSQFNIEPQSINSEKLVAGLEILESQNIELSDDSLPPCLILCGAHDKILHPRIINQLKQSLPHADFHKLVKQGHDLSRSTDAKELILNFINKINHES